MPEQQAFREIYAELMEAILDPVYLAANSADLIQLGVRAEMTTPGVSRFEKNEKLLTAVESQIKTNPRNFIRFLHVLSRDRKGVAICSVQRELSLSPEGQPLV